MHQDAWFNLRRSTSARIALGRAGGSLPTAEVLRFAADHADARDAVFARLDVEQLQKEFADPLVRLESRAVDRVTYLQRPDLGRRLSERSAELLREVAKEEVDVALMVADGLSAMAAQRQAGGVVGLLIAWLKGRGFSVAPLCVVEQGRVAIEDEIGELLGAKIAVVFIGERPGLGSAESLGAYLVYQPAVGKSDAERNCVSNIHPEHLPAAAAVETLGWLIEQAMVRRLSGVGLKDERGGSGRLGGGVGDGVEGVIGGE
jgi:ethanolamine ammonia-lyase small subunit